MAVKSHFSQWGTVTDVYFPRHKKTLKRRPFCFVTFSSADAVHRALAESPLSIAGHPIKSLTAVEERDAYYREKHATGGLGQPPLAGYGAGQAANPFAALPPSLVAALLRSPNSLAEFQRLVQVLSRSPMPAQAPAYGGGPAFDGLLAQALLAQQQQQQQAAAYGAVPGMGVPALPQQMMGLLPTPPDGGPRLSGGSVEQDTFATGAGYAAGPGAWDGLLAGPQPPQAPAAVLEALMSQQAAAQQQMYGAYARGGLAPIEASVARLSLDAEPPQGAPAAPEWASPVTVQEPGPEGAYGIAIPSRFDALLYAGASGSMGGNRTSDGSLVSRSASIDSDSLARRSTGVGGLDPSVRGSWPPLEADHLAAMAAGPEAPRRDIQ